MGSIPLQLAKKTKKVTINLNTYIMKTIKINLEQTNSKETINTSFSFKIQTENEIEIDKVALYLATKLLGIYNIQNNVKDLKGKNRIFNISKSGNWVIDIDVKTEEETYTLISQLAFKLTDLGTENPKEVLLEVVKGWLLFNSNDTL